jgi:hypothetical protein
MRKTLLVVVASGALIAAMPATALAKHHSRHHHARIHHKSIGDPGSPTTGGVGTVTGYDPTSGALTITPTATGATPITATVTSATDVDCFAPPTSGTMTPGDDQNGGQTGGSDWSGGGWGGHEGDQGGGQSDQNQTCTPAVGATVLKADLSLSSTGATWDKVVLETAPSTTPPTVPDTDNDGD